MRPSLLAALLSASAAGGGLAHAQPAPDSAAHHRLLPSLADFPEGSQQVVQTQRGGSTFVRVFQVGDLAVNTALRLFDSPDSAAAYLTRFTISPQAFGVAAGDGLRSIGLVPDSVHADTLPLPGITAFHRVGMVARYYLPRGVFIMTQAVVANERYMILLQVGGADREDDIVSLIRRQASLADQRLGAPSAREPHPRPDVEILTSAATRRYLAALEFGAVGNLRRARDELEALLRDEPTHTSGKLRLRLLDDVAARRTSEAAVTHLFRASLRTSAGKNLEALAELDSAVAASPSYDEAFRLRGRTLVEMGEISRAVEDYNRALGLNPKNVTALLNRGNAYLRLGNPAPALTDFDRAIGMDPVNAEAFVNRGMAHLAGEKDQDAIADFDRAIALDPGMAPAYNNKAQLLEQRGDWSAALSTYESLIARSRPEYKQIAHYARTRIDLLRQRQP